MVIDLEEAIVMSLEELILKATNINVNYSADTMQLDIAYAEKTHEEIKELIKEAYVIGRREALEPRPIEEAPKDGYYTGLYFIEDTTEAPTVMHSARYYKSQNKHLFTGDNFKVEPNYWLPTISLRKGN